MNTKNSLALATLPIFCLTFTNPAQGAPGLLEQAPLYVGPAVESNIMILNDDSGSMDWEAMTRDWNNGGLFSASQPDGSNPAGSGPVKHRDSDDDGFPNCGFNYLYGVEFGSNTYGDNALDCNTADDEAWRFRNSDFNPLYFDPTKDYEPWGGVDINGNPYTDISITNAPDNPYNPGEWIDLTQHNSNWLGGTTRGTSDRDTDGFPDGFRFYTWSDAIADGGDGDGNFDNGEETEYQIARVTDGDAALWGKTAAKVKQNFANWFSYHRSREFVVKYALSQSLSNVTGIRMGYGTINNIDNVRLLIDSMNVDPSTGNKRTLLNRIFSTRSAGSTPLRQNLRNVGRYFECASGNFFGVSGTDCPILPAADFGMCQKNFTIMLTDGFYNGGSPGVGNTDTDGAGIYDGGDYADGFSNTLADVAMHYYERDLRTGLSDEVPPAGIDDAPHQHMTTYTVAFGVTGDLDPGDIKTPGDATDSDPADPAFNWPTNATNAGRVDDLWHTAFNGRGNFFSAQNPNDLIAAIQAAIVSASKGTSSASAAAFNTSKLDTDSTAYQALFNPSDNWKGELTAKKINLDGSIDSTPKWNAGDRLNAVNHSNRQIITYNATTLTGIPFRTLANLSTTQQADLNMGPSGADGNGQARLDYIRGDRGNESQGLFFRDRTNVLGDIVYSSPVFVGKSRGPYTDSAPFPSTTGHLYSEFKTANETRTGVVYVGANDGMLHAFDETTGDEIFAYIPNRVFSDSANEGLHYLTDPSYTHRYYVDLTPVVSEIYINNAWHTFLVGGLGAGGRGLFALDVTDPTTLNNAENNAASIVEWEFTDDDDPDFGYIMGRPKIAKMANGRWAAIVGNGYNARTGTDGRAKLFIIYLDGGQDGVWTLGTDYLKIDTKVGSLSDLNGLSAPFVADTDGDYLFDRAYAGDLHGNMWAFDLSDTNATTPNWKVAYKQGQTPKPLFIAKDASNNRQPITVRPVLSRQKEVATSNSNLPNLMLYFGTGQFITAGDKTSTSTQTFYGIWDKGNHSLDRSDLLTQTVETALTTVQDRVLTDNTISYGNTHKGWLFDLPESGERVTLEAIRQGKILIYATLIPGSQLCLPESSSYIMFVDPVNGGRLDFIAYDVNNDGVIDGNDNINGVPPSGFKANTSTGGLSTLGNYLFKSGDDGSLTQTLVDFGNNTNSGRFSWQEIVRQ